MAQKFLTNVELEAGLVDGSNSAGTSGYLLSSTGTATSWVDPAAVSVGESEQVHIACKNTSGVAISKGDPVYITGTVGTSFIIQIAKADASDSAKMPAVGLAETDLGLNDEGFVIVSGVLKNLTTDPLSTSDGTPSSNDTVYVKVGGGLTKTKPTGSGNLIQNVGKVGRVSSANSGSLAVSTIMRTNDVPNLTTGKIWVGSPTYTTESTVVHLDETNGRMGIGTTNPGVKLHLSTGNSSLPNLDGGTLFVIDAIQGSTGNYSAMSILSGTAGVSSLYLGDSDAENRGSLRYNNSNNSLSLGTFGSEKMRIDFSGNVGIGTTSPSTKFQISTPMSSNPTSNIFLDVDGTNTSGGGGSIIFGTSASAGTITNYNAKIQGVRSSLGDGSSDLQFYTTHVTNTGAASAQRMVIKDSGNVGIGATNPSRKLSVAGAIELTVADTTLHTGHAAIRRGDAGEMFLDAPGDITVTIDTNNNNTDRVFNVRKDTGAELFRVQENGNVGIGTTSPFGKLHVDSGSSGQTSVSSSASDLVLENSSNSGITILSPSTTSGNIFFGDESDFFIGGIRYYHTNDSLLFYTNNSEWVRINSSGNVGIGTTSPATKLDINGITTGRGFRTYQANTDYSLISRDSAGNPPLYVQSANSGTNQWIARFNYGSAQANAGQNVLTVAKDNSYFLNTNVGIGTTSPNSKLEVNVGTDQNVAINSYNSIARISSYNDAFSLSQPLIINGSDLRFDINGNEKMRIDSSGNVGIGTTSPGVPLEVNGTARFGNSSTGISFNIGSTDVYKISGADTSFNGWNSLHFMADSEDGLFLEKDTNNVGIGTTSPISIGGHSGVLTLYGSNATALALKDAVSEGHLRFDDSNFKFTNSGGTVRMQIEADTGNVGIGTTSPQSKLQVDGGVQMADDTDTASASKVGTLRYRTSGNNSYVDMCMQTGASTYEWINIVQNNW